ncbi:pyruvate phosphate dikinase [Deinococcus grandis]|uniref:Pyruvate phosphate dikinase n=1 Tax=Deinococcus grandis TaxID=57498 RepID=A0A124BRB6_9DEIO|nr:hypothetical protein [Deinococcus grandis]BBN95789.1 hypothetical protein DEGR_25220 [Deinococcus grandis]GAQ20727.1 pyruvate phosphate dikinase [Deinococcus grandis]
MSRNQFYYLDAFGAEIEKGACHDGTYYLFYDSNVIINLSREELNHKNTKIDDMIMFISSIEKSYVQYDTACLEMFSRSFSKSLDEQKDEMIGFAIKLEGWMSDRGIITERSNFVSMNDYLLLYKSVKHLRVMQLCLMAITFTLIENRDKTPLEKFELFAKWYDDKVGIRLVLIIRLAILIFTT